MKYSPGSAVFLVDEVLFQIPKALLQRHSEALEGMLASSQETGDPIELGDDAKSFRLFQEVLLNPFACCLTPGHSSNNANNLKELLVISNKYCATAIESLALEQLLPLIERTTMTSPLIDALDLAFRIGSQELEKRPREVIMDKIWCRRLDKVDSLALLAVAKRHGDEPLLGASYYAIALNGEAWWMSCPSLSSKDRRKLVVGTSRCAQAWHEESTGWIRDSGMRSPRRTRQVLDLLALSTRRQAAMGLEWFDVVGKLAATLDAIDEDIALDDVSKMLFCQGVMRPLVYMAKKRLEREVCGNMFRYEQRLYR